MNKQKNFIDLIKNACFSIEKEKGVPALFIMSQAALESGWGVKSIGFNLFGIKAGKNWTGLKKLVTTTEYLDSDKYSSLFPKVHSITKMPSGKFKYIVDDYFRDYKTIEECLLDHCKLLTNVRYTPALIYKNNIYDYAYKITKLGYSTSKPEDYAGLILKLSNQIKNLL